MLRRKRFAPFLVSIAVAGALHGFGAKDVVLRALGTARSLPAPTGPFRVGRVTMSLTDASRQERFPPGGGVRRLMVDVWYPAEASDGPAAFYFAPSVFSTPQSAEVLKPYLRAAFDRVSSGLVETHAVDSAAFARGAGPSPVLLFSHGGGEARETYATQLADLASHGYVVAAITHTFDSVLAVFPDGRHAALVPDRWPPPKTSEIPHLPPSEEASPDRLRWWTDDMRFVLDELTRLNRSGPSASPFAGHLDLSRSGAFGHSAGGQASAHACQVEPRLRACLNQDGLSAKAPYYLDDRGWGMDQTFMLIVRAADATPPSDDELSQMKLTRAQAVDLLARVRNRQDLTLRRTGQGAYRVTLHAESTSHADFGDLPLLQAADDSEADKRALVLRVVTSFTRAFFDKALKGSKAPLPDPSATGGIVERVEEFPAATLSSR